MQGFKPSCPQRLHATTVAAHDIQVCSMLRARDGIFSGQLLVGGPGGALQVGTEEEWSSLSVHGNVSASGVQASTGQVAVLKVGSDSIAGNLEVGTDALSGSVTVNGAVFAGDVTADLLTTRAVNRAWLPLTPPSALNVDIRAQSLQAFSVVLTDTSNVTGYQTVNLLIPGPLSGRGLVPTATYDTNVIGYAQNNALLPVLVGFQTTINNEYLLDLAFGWTAQFASPATNRVATIHVHISLF